MAHLPAAAEAALLCIAHLAADPPAQDALLSEHALGHLLPAALRYDSTLSAEALSAFGLPFPSPPRQCPGMMALLNSELARPSVAASVSYQAALAAQALARLAGAGAGGCWSSITASLLRFGVTLYAACTLSSGLLLCFPYVVV